MERDRQISRAKAVLRDLMGRYVKPHNRIHKQAAEDNAERLRALDGICGKCEFLELKFPHLDGKNRVVLDCTKGHSPVALYGKTPMGEQAFCEDYRKAK